MRQISKHIEWLVFTAGLLLLGLMNPETAGTSFCLFEWAGFEFCPGEGLGHSIAYSFRGDFTSALEAHLLGPFAIIILMGRIISIWRELYAESTITSEQLHHG